MHVSIFIVLSANNLECVSPVLWLDWECLYDQFLGDAGGLGSVGISLKLAVVVSLLSKTILEMPQTGWRTGLTRMPIYSTSNST